MRHVRRLAVAFSFAAACSAVIGCSPDRQSGANKRTKAAASKSPAAATAPEPTPVATPTSYSQPTPEAAAAISGLEMPDAKSMLITNEAMTNSLSAPVTESVAPAGQTIPQAPLVPGLDN